MKIVRYHLDRVNSTNTWAKAHVFTFEPEALTVITAKEQTAGRGRYDRKWISPPSANLIVTFCLFLPSSFENAYSLSLVLPLSVVKTLGSLGIEAKIKRPNDILIDRKKVSGILCETTSVSDRLCMIMGLGLNVNMTEEQLREIDQPATSLFVETRVIQDVDRILEQLEHHFVCNIKTFFTGGFPLPGKIYNGKTKIE